ncbi:MAG: hypothetical protein H7X86_05390 [Gorillibacterium sp.]|nr:hypothetical protein [Gorillibacterium sp.]
MGQSKVPVGIVLLAIFVFLLLGKLGVIGFLLRVLWPFLLLGAGLILHYYHFRGKGTAVLLVPGGILLTYSLIYFICLIFGWQALSIIWPGFLFGVGVGLYEWASFDRNLGYCPRWVYPTSIGLAIVSIVLFLLALVSSNVIFFIFILLAATLTFLLLQWRTR